MEIFWVGLEYLGHIGLGLLLMLLATFVFDIIHVLLHILANSRWAWLKAIGDLHTVHHEFLDEDLRIHEDKIPANVRCHVIPEFITQIVVTTPFFLVFPPLSVVVALGIEVLTFVLIMRGTPGFDLNHRYVDKLVAYQPSVFCMPEYHLLHHVYPTAYFGSWIKALDYLLRSGTAFKKRKVVITGCEYPFAAHLSDLLEKQGSVVIRLTGNQPEQDKDMAALLEEANILVLCHQQTHENSYANLARQFCDIHQDRSIPMEIWALAAQNEFSDNSQYDQELGYSAAFVPKARYLFTSDRAIYRHIVADGVYTPERKAKAVMRRIRRGFNYVPASINAQILWHFLRFILLRPKEI